MTDASGATGSGQGTGGSSDAGQAQGAQATQGGAAADQAQQTQGAQATGQAATGQAQGQQAQAQPSEGDAYLAQRFPGFANFPAEAQAALRARNEEAARYQREAGDQRINAKNEAAQKGAREALAQAAKLAGLDIPGLTDAKEGEGDPKALATQITSVTGERDTAMREGAAYRAALLAMMPGTDAEKADALDFLAFKLQRDATYSGDPTDSEYGAKLSATVTNLVAADSRFRAQSGTAQTSGVENLGGSNGQNAITSEQFNRMSMGERQQLKTNDPETYRRLVGA